MVTCSRLAVAVGEAIEVVVIREQTSAVVVLLGIVNDDGCVRLYSSMLMMVCSGMLAPDPSACDVRRRGDIVANVLWRSRALQAAEFHPSVSIFPEPCIFHHTESCVLHTFLATMVKPCQLFISTRLGRDNHALKRGLHEYFLSVICSESCPFPKH